MSPELRKKIASFGCNDTCIFGVVGQHTNGGCRCLGAKYQGKMTPNERRKTIAGILFMRQELERLEDKIEEMSKEIRELKEDYAHALATGGSSPYATGYGDE